jgi:hypothetical protein
MTDRIAEGLPRLKARMAGAFQLLEALTATFSKAALLFYFRSLFELLHGCHGACGVVCTLCRLRASVAFGDRMLV